MKALLSYAPGGPDSLTLARIDPPPFAPGVVAHDPVSFLRKTPRTLLALHAAGSIHPRIGARFPLEQGAKAIAMLETRGAVGKIIVEIADRDRPGTEG